MKITNLKELKAAIDKIANTLSKFKHEQIIDLLNSFEAALRERLKMFEDDKRYDDNLVRSGQKVELRRVLGDE